MGRRDSRTGRPAGGRWPFLVLTAALALTAGCAGSDSVVNPPPQTTTVELRHDGNNASAPQLPGALLYSASVTPSGGSWNTHTLQSPVTVPAGDLWIAVEFEHAVSQRTLGCDPGPAVPNGDWLYASRDGSWLPLNQRYAVSINWNIRATVEVEQAASTTVVGTIDAG